LEKKISLHLRNAHWSILNTLSFDNNKFGEDGTTELAKINTWNQLEKLI
jgi:hypothetical protein